MALPKLYNDLVEENALELFWIPPASILSILLMAVFQVQENRLVFITGLAAVANPGAAESTVIFFLIWCHLWEALTEKVYNKVILWLSWISHFYLKKKKLCLLIYWRKVMEELGEGKTERSLIYWFTPQLPQWPGRARPKPGVGNFFQVFHVCAGAPSTWTTSYCFLWHPLARVQSVVLSLNFEWMLMFRRWGPENWTAVISKLEVVLGLPCQGEHTVNFIFYFKIRS